MPLRSATGSCVREGMAGDEQQMLCAAHPARVHVPGHDKAFPCALALTAKPDVKTLARYLMRHWLNTAPRRRLKARDVEQGTTRT
jgi:hypothetical protein